MSKRLEKRQHRLDNICKTIKRGPYKCKCNKCTDARSMETGLLKNYPCKRHSTHERPSLIFDETQINSPINLTELNNHENITRNPPEDHVDLQQSKSDKVAWWTNTIHGTFMPPLIEEHVKPTRSECSTTSTTDFHSSNTETSSSDSFESSSCSTSSSDDSDYKSCRAEIFALPLHSRSKSNPEIAHSTDEMKLKSVAKSVSIPLGQRPNELRGMKILAKRKLEMKRPVRKTTSYTTDCFNNCIKCTKIISKS